MQSLDSNRVFIPVRAKLLDDLFRFEAWADSDEDGDENGQPGQAHRPRKFRLYTPMHERVDPRKQKWYIRYVLDAAQHARDPNHQVGIEFRRRFRVPWSVFNDMCHEARTHPHFDGHQPGQRDALG